MSHPGRCFEHLEGEAGMLLTSDKAQDSFHNSHRSTVSRVLRLRPAWRSRRQVRVEEARSPLLRLRTTRGSTPPLCSCGSPTFTKRPGKASTQASFLCQQRLQKANDLLRDSLVSEKFGSRDFLHYRHLNQREGICPTYNLPSLMSGHWEIGEERECPTHVLTVLLLVLWDCRASRL